LGVLTILFLVFVYVGKTKEQSFKESSAAIENEVKEVKNEVSFKDKRYLYELVKVENIEKLSLIPNFDTKVRSGEAYENNNCRLLVNTGFYAEGGKAIGLFIYDNKILNKWTNNLLLDGVLSINDFYTPRITRSVPEDHLQIGVQSGPILKENGKNISLTIKNDKPERRVVAGITGENTLYFLVLYDKNQNFAGPLLSELPEALAKIEDREMILFADTINLDGGTASTFMTKDLKLSEITPVGGFFCLK